MEPHKKERKLVKEKDAVQNPPYTDWRILKTEKRGNRVSKPGTCIVLCILNMKFLSVCSHILQGFQDV